MISSDSSTGFHPNEDKTGEPADICPQSRLFGIAFALLSATPRRSAEEYVTEDWAAVARAINQRMAELDLNQRELIERSRVSKAIVGEIQNNTIQRRRSGRTLVALSLALEWHPDHLSAVLNSRTPPKVGEPVLRSENDVPGRLAVIEHQLREIADRLGDINVINDRLNEIDANVQTLLERMRAQPRQQSR